MFDKFLGAVRKAFGKSERDKADEGEENGDGPALLKAAVYQESDFGEFRWNMLHNSEILTTSNEALTIEWGPKKPEYTGKYDPCFVPASTCMHLHSGEFQWDFIVDEMADAQIGMGFLLLWDCGPDWGFFGYLGASSTAWAYDPSTGDVVCDTNSIEGDLPVFADRHTGTVTVHAELPRTGTGTAWFEVAGKKTKPIQLSKGAVILPAACMLKEGQKITLANFQRR